MDFYVKNYFLPYTLTNLNPFTLMFLLQVKLSFAVVNQMHMFILLYVICLILLSLVSCNKKYF